MPEPRDDSEARRPPAVPVSHPIETQRILSLFSSSTRSGYWEPPERMEVLAMFGGVKLDFRNANLYSGPTIVNCFALFGGVEIVVPVELDVDANGTGLFGGFDHQTGRKSRRRLFRRGREDDLPEAGSDPDDEPPLLRIRGFALFGGVSVRVK